MSDYISTYWNGISSLQERYESLWEELVPKEGKAKTERGEILRIATRLYYDVHNNGGCNFDVYYDWREWLLAHVPAYAHKTTMRFIKQPKYGKITDDEYKFYDKYMDWVVKYVEALESLEGLERELK